MAFWLTESDILTRLSLCLNEVEGINRVFTSAPTNALNSSDLPIAILRVGAGESEMTSYGVFNTQRSFVGALIVADTAATDVGDAGNKAISDGIPYIHRIKKYLLQHPHLSTSVLGDLAGLLQVVKYKDEGSIIQTISGADYSALQFTIQVSYEESL